MSKSTKAEKRKPGRKPKPKEEREGGGPILVRATPKERVAIRRRADATGLSLSRYLVARGLNDDPPMTPAEREEAGRLLFELHKAGANLNQVARRINAVAISGGTINADEIANALATVRAAATAVKQRMKT